MNPTRTGVLDVLDGTVTPELPALPELVSVGVGHSMGAMLTVEQQATHRTHTALALLGFGNRGLPDLLDPEVVAATSRRYLEAYERLTGHPLPGEF